LVDDSWSTCPYTSSASMSVVTPPYHILSHHTPPPAPSPLSLHDALPIFPTLALALLQTGPPRLHHDVAQQCRAAALDEVRVGAEDRKSTRLNSSHGSISYAVFCLKKKKFYVQSMIR